MLESWVEELGLEVGLKLDSITSRRVPNRYPTDTPAEYLSATEKPFNNFTLAFLVPSIPS
jgi:hypothetical protein